MMYCPIFPTHSQPFQYISLCLDRSFNVLSHGFWAKMQSYLNVSFMRYSFHIHQIHPKMTIMNLCRFICLSMKFCNYNEKVFVKSNAFRKYVITTVHMVLTECSFASAVDAWIFCNDEIADCFEITALHSLVFTPAVLSITR